MTRLIEIAESVKTLLAAGTFSLANLPAYHPDHLRDLGQFTSVLTVTYRAEEE